MLTTQQKRVLDFIRAFIHRHGHSPSLREIGEGIDIQSRGAVHRHVQTLIDRGVLKRTRSGWRRVTAVPRALCSLSGATTTTRPTFCSSLTSFHSPGAKMPSSLVTSIFIMPAFVMPSLA